RWERTGVGAGRRRRARGRGGTWRSGGARGTAERRLRRRLVGPCVHGGVVDVGHGNPRRFLWPCGGTGGLGGLGSFGVTPLSLYVLVGAGHYREGGRKPAKRADGPIRPALVSDPI